jgi:hypothetical protein
MTENRVGKRIRSRVMGGEVAESYDCAQSDENNNYFRFGGRVLAIGRTFVWHPSSRSTSRRIIKCIPNSLN